MPCVLLTLASEEVRGEAFFLGRQVTGNNIRAVFFTAKKHWKQTAYSSCRESFFFNGKLAPAQRANGTIYHVQYLFVFWAFIQSTTCTERTVKGEIVGHSQPVTCSFCCYVICMCYTSFAPQQEKFRARTLQATTAAPPHAVLRESLLCVNLAAKMGVCSDVKAISPSLTIVFHLRLMHIVMCCIRRHKVF